MDDPRPTRQQRLPDSDLPEIANLRVVRKPLLSATTLAGWLYCRAKPFVARVVERLGIDVSTPAMRLGAQAHADVQGALVEAAPPSELTVSQALARKVFAFENEVHLVDERRKLHGYVDILYTAEGRLHLLELKNTRPPGQPDPLWGARVWHEHGMQVHLYGVVARAMFGVRPELRLSYLKGGSKERALEELAESGNPQAALESLDRDSMALEHGPREESLVLEEAERFRLAERATVIPTPNHANPRKCASCTVRDWCPRRLDRPGDFVRLNPQLLDDGP